MSWKSDRWVFNESDMTAICPHGNEVEVDGECWEDDCVNPLF
jgi:hypothetical protein